MSRLQLTNSRPDVMRFSLEPWGEEYTLPPETTLEVTARGPEGGVIEVDIGVDGVTAWGWAGSMVMLARDGIPLGPAVRTPVPTTSGWSEQQAAGVDEPSAAAPRM
jgi:hypothetical protein